MRLKNTVCTDIESKWNNLKHNLLQKDDGKTTVNMQHFETVECLSKNGKVVKRLKAVSTKANLNFILEFISSLLTKMVHHRNQLRHYRNIIHEFREHFDAMIIDVDFSENLSVAVKFEPQSLHWSHEQITVHLGLLKYHGEKSYHPYLSHDKIHDHSFVHLSIKEMLKEVTINTATTIIIESDNCSSQYKSCAHFADNQQLSNKYIQHNNNTGIWQNMGEVR